ncbi:hypothetical protein PsYK624_028240 [Phanerochaete sordida]|uniref:Uncharacterized protein n=1 Tax=Phanerochaete sordida TaxID=48140 RepID=A0A9P3LA84_9APHY|nr:hypothetical protein PsYK624_028240 [Phanerochaete sordida]
MASLIAGSNYISFFVSPLTSVLISRFLLDLRRVAHQNAGSLASSVCLTSELPSLGSLPNSNDNVSFRRMLLQDSHLLDSMDAKPEEKGVGEADTDLEETLEGYDSEYRASTSCA